VDSYIWTRERFLETLRTLVITALVQIGIQFEGTDNNLKNRASTINDKHTMGSVLRCPAR